MTQREIDKTLDSDDGETGRPLHDAVPLFGVTFGSKDFSPRNDVRAEKQADHDHRCTRGVKTGHDLIDGFAQTRDEQVGQVSPQGPSSPVPKPVADRPMDDRMLIFDEDAGPASERRSEYFQGIMRVGKNPDEIGDSRDHEQDSQDPDVRPRAGV